MKHAGCLLRISDANPSSIHIAPFTALVQSIESPFTPSSLARHCCEYSCHQFSAAAQQQQQQCLLVNACSARVAPFPRRALAAVVVFARRLAMCIRRRLGRLRHPISARLESSRHALTSAAPAPQNADEDQVACSSHCSAITASMLGAQHLVLLALVFYLASTVYASLLTRSSIAGEERCAASPMKVAVEVVVISQLFAGARKCNCASGRRRVHAAGCLPSRGRRSLQSYPTQLAVPIARAALQWCTCAYVSRAIGRGQVSCGVTERLCQRAISSMTQGWRAVNSLSRSPLASSLCLAAPLTLVARPLISARLRLFKLQVRWLALPLAWGVMAWTGARSSAPAR